jgi:hypothetical protein
LGNYDAESFQVPAELYLEARSRALAGEAGIRPVVHGRYATFLSVSSARFKRASLAKLQLVAFPFGRPLKAALGTIGVAILPAVNDRPKPDFVGRKPPEGDSSRDVELAVGLGAKSSAAAVRRSSASVFGSAP